MKTRKIMAVLGSTMLAGALALTGCSIGKDGVKVRANGTEANLKAELDDELTGADYGEVPSDDEEYYGCRPLEDDFVSTNGELEGQLEYMALIPDCNSVDWASYPEDDKLQDVSSIEDEDLRALAQEYMDNGFSIVDPEIMREYGSPYLGDGEYMFTDGFYAICNDDSSITTVFVFKMNETLFDYFLAGNMCCGSEIVEADDGTVISYENDLQRVEFNRDTGIGTFTGWY